MMKTNFLIKVMFVIEFDFWYFKDDAESTCDRMTCECDRLAAECFGRHEYHPEYYDLDPWTECSKYQFNSGPALLKLEIFAMRTSAI